MVTSDYPKSATKGERYREEDLLECLVNLVDENNDDNDPSTTELISAAADILRNWAEY